MTTPSTKPDTKPGERVGRVLSSIPRTYVVRYEDGHEREITGSGYQVVSNTDSPDVLLEFLDHEGRIRATFRKWASVVSKLHDEEHPERGSDVP
jgi:hypothetical protein